MNLKEAFVQRNEAVPLDEWEESPVLLCLIAAKYTIIIYIKLHWSLSKMPGDPEVNRTLR